MVNLIKLKKTCAAFFLTITLALLIWVFSGQPYTCPTIEFKIGGVLQTPYTSIDNGKSLDWEHWTFIVKKGGLLDKNGFKSGDYLVGTRPDAPDDMNIRACEVFSNEEPFDFWVRRGGRGLPIAERPLIKLTFNPKLKTSY